MGIAKAFGYRESDHVLQFASVGFDVFIEQALAPLFSGARLILKSGDFWGHSEFFNAIQRYEITVANLTPAFWELLTTDGMESRPRFKSLRLMIVGGDVMKPEVVLRWRQTESEKIELLNVYGPTETVITATLYRVPADISGQRALQRIPIGHPLVNRQAYILGPSGQPESIGIAGELHLGGEILARGYLGRPALTAEKFVPDPFRKGESRLYRTGDLARYRADGLIDFLGRRDQQVKIRGYRVELGEIETGLRQHDCVRDAVVIATKDEPGQQRLVAYVVLRPGATIDARELKDHARRILPKYMVPTAYLALQEFPLTASGKVDRSKLPLSVPDQPDSAPQRFSNGVEEIIAGIWEQVLCVEMVGMEDDFFELGGHSLLATQVISRIRESLEVELPLRSIFESPTVSGLAELVEQESRRSQFARSSPDYRIERRS